MSDEIAENQCECPQCVLADNMRKTVAMGCPPEEMVVLVLDTLATVAAEFGVTVLAHRESEVIH